MSFFFTKRTQAGQHAAANGLSFQSATYGKAIPVQYGVTRMTANIIWYNDFHSVSQSTSVGGKGGVGGGGGGKGGGGSVTYTYYTSAIFALSEGVSNGVPNAYIDKNIIDPASLGFSYFNGSYSQAPWGYLTTNHPAEALNYHGIAYLAAANYSLGTSPQLPNHNFECRGIFYGQMTNGKDTDPSMVISDLLTNTKYGINFSSFAVNGVVADFTVYQQYVRAFDFGVSPAYVEQRPCAEVFNELVKNTNSEFVWSGNTLSIVPYGDISLTANGYTYTAPSAPLYALTDDDFIPNGNGNPVEMTRKRGSDVINSIKLECLDRSNSYNPATIEAKDQLLIDLYGLRQDSSRTGHIFCDTATARASVQLQLQREQVRNMYTFTTSQRYILIDPMDIVSITDVYLGVINQWVRIKEISEDSAGNLTFVAEEYMGGNGNAPLYSLQTSSGFTADYNSSPGNVNTPVIFDAPVQLATMGDFETWVALSGGSNWGGCDVYVSADGNTYKLVGRQNGASRQGLLTATFPISADPDTTNTCSVNLSESFGTLMSGTQSDADLGHSLCFVDGELISYKTAVLTSTYNYDLKDYIRRGQYGTTINSHPSGSMFARLDNGIFKYPYDKSQIGKTFYIKFVSFNIYGGGYQTLSEVPPYAHFVVGPSLPSNVTGFTVTQNLDVTIFRWDAVDDYALKGYDILYGPRGQGINTSTFLTESAAGTEMTNANVPSGDWTFYIRARDIADHFSPVPATFDLKIATQSTVIYSIIQEPDWLGILVNFVKHFSGVLIPVGTLNSAAYTQIAAPAAPSLSQMAGGSLAAATYYVKVTYLNIYGSETIASAETSLAVSANNLLIVTSPAPLSGAVNWNVYVSTSAGTETLQNPVPYGIGSNWTLSTGGLISGAALPTSNATGWEVFDIFVVDPVTSATYTAPTLDTTFDDTLLVYSTIMGKMGPGQSGDIQSQLKIDTWLTAQSDPNSFTKWAVGYATMRFLRAQLDLAIVAGSVPYITDFTPTVARAPKIQDVNGVIIAAGGSTVTFPLPYHQIPHVEAENTSATALFVTVTSVTATTFICNIFNTAGTSVGGTINYRVTGV